MAGKRKVYVVGVGMTKFEKPGARDDFDYPDMAKEAGMRALKDCGLSYSAVQQAFVGYVYGDSTCGQRAVYELGLSGIPVVNVNNNCSTGSTALFLAKQAVEGGLVDCALALGFEKMESGSLSAKFDDRTHPLERHLEVMSEAAEGGIGPQPLMAQMFGNAGAEHMKRYGTTAADFARVAVKNHRHSANNPYAQFRDVYTEEQVLASKTIFGVLTKLQCCPTSDGGAAAVVCSEAFVKKHGLEGQAVEVAAMALTTDTKNTFTDNSCMTVVGSDCSKRAADQCYRAAGVCPQDVDVVELHDCFSANELLTYEALGLCPVGQGGSFVSSGSNTYGGRVVVNPSGGLISKGHALGATGLAQCAELCWQLRRMCGERQVHVRGHAAAIALQHNIGLGSACVVAIYRLGFPSALKPVPSSNPAVAIPATPLDSKI